MDISKIRKAVVAVLGFVANVVVLVPATAVPDKYQPWLVALVSFLTAVGVYHMPNEITPSAEG